MWGWFGTALTSFEGLDKNTSFLKSIGCTHGSNSSCRIVTGLRMTRVCTISQYPVDQWLHLVVIWNRLDVFGESLIEYYTFEKDWHPVLATNARVAISSSIVQLLYQWYHSTLLSECNNFWFLGTALMHLKGSASQSLCWRCTRYMSLLVEISAHVVVLH